MSWSTVGNKNFPVCGHVAKNWESIRSIFEQNLADDLDVGASLCIYYQGECVVDLAGGWKDAQTKKEPYTTDTLQLVFSTSKGVLAAAIALCVERGWLNYDAPIAKYWPEFATNGKETITVGDVMSHRAGVPYTVEQLTEEDMYDWSRMTSLLAAQKPQWEPGKAHGYHAHTIGFIAGELVRRVDPQHRSYGQFIRDELDSGFYVGIPDDTVEARVSPLVFYTANVSAPPPMDEETVKAFFCSGATLPKGSSLLFNEPALHYAQLPSVNGITNARSLARIYSLLIGNVNEDGKEQKCLLNEKTLSEATKKVTPQGEPDQNWCQKSTTFSRGGFQTYGDCFNIFGDDVFGHSGYGGSCGFAYPPYQLSYAYVCNSLDPTAFILDRRTARLIEAIKIILQNLSSFSSN